MLSALLLGIVAIYGSQMSAQPSPVPSLDDARQLFTQGRLGQSLSELDALSRQIPEPAGVERLRGFIFYQQNKFV